MTWEHWIALASVLAPLVRAMLELSRIRRDMDRMLAKLDAVEDAAARCDARADAASAVEHRVRRLEGLALARTGSDT